MSVITYEERRTTEEKQTDAKLLKYVKRGIALLEEKYGPDWVDHIDLKTLSLASMNNCVLGQLYGEFSDGLKALDIPCGAITHGFSLAGYERQGWLDLQAAWIDVLTPRVKKGEAS